MRKLIIIFLLPLFAAGQVTVDSYPESNYSSDRGMYTGSYACLYQSFACSQTVTLDSCKFYLKKFNSPTGNAVAYVYAHSGTYGTNSVPTGTALATSGNLDVTSITTSYVLYKFTFSGANQITLTNGTKYVLILKYDAGGSSNYIYCGRDNTSPAHAGNYGSANDCATYSASTTYDLIFYVFGHVATTNKNIFMNDNF